MSQTAAFGALSAVLAALAAAQAPPAPAPAPARPAAAPILAPAAAPVAALPGVTAPPPEAPPPEGAVTEDKPAPVVLPTPPKAPAAPAVPLKRPRTDQAVVQVLDKVTAGSVRLTLDVGKTVAYQSLTFTLRACETSAADEPRPEAAAYLLIESQPVTMGRKTAPRTVFRGWMYASSPSLTPFEHPIYDVWMVACKSSNPAPPPAPPAPPPPAPRPRPAATIPAATSATPSTPTAPPTVRPAPAPTPAAPPAP